jgi:MoxR-like ATPase
MLQMLEKQHPVDSLEAVVTATELKGCQEAIKGVYVDPKVRAYLMQIVQETRQHEDLLLGASPRASIALFRCGQAMAALRGRDFVLPDDIKKIVLAHRLVLKPESRLRRVTSDQVVDSIVAEIAVPSIDQGTLVEE